MTWEIFLGISALCAFIISIMTIVVKVTKTLTAIEINLKNLASSLGDIREKNEKEHSSFEKRMLKAEKSVYIQAEKIRQAERM